VAVLALATLMLGPAPAAHAHAELILSLPDDGAEVPAVPDEVLLSFSEELLPDTVVVSVEDSNGMVVRVLELDVDGADVIVTWPPGMSGDEYTVNYRVVSGDGHPVEGSVYFRVSNPGGAAPTTPPLTAGPTTAATTAAAQVADDDTGGSMAPIAAILVGLGVGAAAVLAILLLRRRDPAANTPPDTPGDPQ
jgi:methionine-rich copper-binding protein CopC